MPFACPDEHNGFLHEHVARLLNSYRRLTGRDLVDPALTSVEAAGVLFRSPAVILSHDTAADPIISYGNLACLSLFEISWEELVVMPSRLTAELPDRQERARLLERVSTHGFIDDYSGVRVSATGRRFRIECATVWNVTDEAGQMVGQAATFERWFLLEDTRA